jgi:hypothetical protein
VSKNGALIHDKGAYTLLYPEGKVLSYAPDQAVMYESIEDWQTSITFYLGAGYIK